MSYISISCWLKLPPNNSPTHAPSNNCFFPDKETVFPLLQVGYSSLEPQKPKVQSLSKILSHVQFLFCIRRSMSLLWKREQVS